MICGKKYVVSQVALSEPLRPSVIELFFVLAEVVQTNVDKEVSDLQAVDSRRLDPLSDKPCQLDILWLPFYACCRLVCFLSENGSGCFPQET